MSKEKETKKLLQFRETLENRIQELQLEIQNLHIAIERLDKLIVTTGFRTFTTPVTPMQITTDDSKISETEQISITSKDGTVLGKMNVKDHTIHFTPSDSFNFTINTPPFQSFLVDRVLENMRKTDQERATNGELDPSEILQFEIQDHEAKITKLIIQNYGGERRLREINSSLRWTFDKMYDKIIKG
jgi:hypothetical protein